MKLKTCFVLLLCFFSLFSYGEDSIFLDFYNQKITDIIYSLADICGESVFVDETVTGNATFHFEESSFENALDKFADYCQLYITKNDGIYNVSKVKIEKLEDSAYNLNTENVLVEPFLNFLSRETNTTIMYDSLPTSAYVTIRVQNASLEDILNLTLVKLSGFGLERIASGYYLTKNSGTINRRNIDVFTISNVGELFAINIQKAAFNNVIETLFKKANKEYSIFVVQDLQIENLTYSNKTFDEILNLILQHANCDYSVENGIYYIFDIQRKDITKNFKQTKIIQIKNLNVNNILSLFPNDLNVNSFIKIDDYTNSVILSGSDSEISPIEDFIKKIDIPISGRYYKKFELKNGEIDSIIAAIPKQYLLSEIIKLPTNMGFVTQVTEETEQRINEFIYLLDENKNSFPIKLKYIKSDELIQFLPPSTTRENIVLTNEPNTVFFKGSLEQYNSFCNDLEFIDKPKQQIKYQILVIQRQKTNGLSWSSGISSGSSVNDFGYVWSGMLSNIFNINFDIISEFGIQFAGQLNAELSEGKANVLADTTLNGISGEIINFSNTNTYRYRDIIADKNGDLYTSTTREIASGLTLNINGWVSGDDMITVKIDAQVSKQGLSDSSSNDTTNPPSTSEKKVTTNIRTRSGEPIIIGGLFQQETDITEKRVPFLGYIPFLGNLFKTKTISVADTEFVIYLVPFVEKNELKNLTEDENLIRLQNKYGDIIYGK